MSNALALKTLSLKTGKPALRLDERLQDDRNIIRAMNRRLKRPYAKKGWWWSGLWDPAAKIRRMVESIEMLFEMMNKKTYEEIHTSAKKEETEIEHKFQIHSQNMEIEVSVLHIANSIGDSSENNSMPNKTDKKNEKTAWQDNVIDLILYKQEKIKPTKTESTSVPLTTAVANEQLEEYKIKIKTVRKNSALENFDSETKDPKAECVLTCTAPEVTQIIASLVSKTANDISQLTMQSVNSEKQVEISIGNGIVPNLVEIFVEEMVVPLVTNIPPTTAQPQDIIAQINTQSVNSVPAPSSSQNTQVQNNTEPEELVVPPVEIPQVAQPIINNILFFPAVQQIKIDAVEAMPLQTQNSRMQEIQMQEEIPVASVLVQPIIVIPFSIQTAPLIEDIMTEQPSLQKTPSVSNPKKDSSITVFFSKGNNGIKLKQTDAEASPED